MYIIDKKVINSLGLIQLRSIYQEISGGEKLRAWCEIGEARKTVIEKIDDINKVTSRKEVCSYCSSDKLVNSGTCKVCIECGTTSGCS